VLKWNVADQACRPTLNNTNMTVDSAYNHMWVSAQHEFDHASHT